MKKISIFGIISVLAIGLFAGCSINVHSMVKKTLELQYMNDKLQTKNEDLSIDGKCPGTLPLNAINAEPRTEKYIVLEVSTDNWYTHPDKFIDLVVKYAEEKFKASNLTVDENTGKQILISLEEVKLDGAWVFESSVKLKIEIPEINYVQIYKGIEGSGQINTVISYGIHLALNEFLNDPVFQKYVKCH